MKSRHKMLVKFFKVETYLRYAHLVDGWIYLCPASAVALPLLVELVDGGAGGAGSVAAGVLGVRRGLSSCTARRGPA